VERYASWRKNPSPERSTAAASSCPKRRGALTELSIIDDIRQAFRAPRQVPRGHRGAVERCRARGDASGGHHRGKRAHGGLAACAGWGADFHTVPRQVMGCLPAKAVCPLTLDCSSVAWLSVVCSAPETWTSRPKEWASRPVALTSCPIVVLARKHEGDCVQARKPGLRD